MTQWPWGHDCLEEAIQNSRAPGRRIFLHVSKYSIETQQRLNPRLFSKVYFILWTVKSIARSRYS